MECGGGKRKFAEPIEEPHWVLVSMTDPQELPLLSATKHKIARTEDKGIEKKRKEKRKEEEEERKEERKEEGEDKGIEKERKEEHDIKKFHLHQHISAQDVNKFAVAMLPGGLVTASTFGVPILKAGTLIRDPSLDNELAIALVQPVHVTTQPPPSLLVQIAVDVDSKYGRCPQALIDACGARSRLAATEEPLYSFLWFLGGHQTGVPFLQGQVNVRAGPSAHGMFVLPSEVLRIFDASVDEAKGTLSITPREFEEDY